MRSHTSVNDIAVCVVTARELDELLDLAEKALPSTVASRARLSKASGKATPKAR